MMDHFFQIRSIGAVESDMPESYSLLSYLYLTRSQIALLERVENAGSAKNRDRICKWSWFRPDTLKWRLGRQGTFRNTWNTDISFERIHACAPFVAVHI